MKTKEDEQKEFAERSEKFRDAAFPVTLTFSYESDPTQNYVSTSKGLSKREYFASEALHGMVENMWRMDDSMMDITMHGKQI